MSYSKSDLIELEEYGQINELNELNEFEEYNKEMNKPLESPLENNITNIMIEEPSWIGLPLKIKKNGNIYYSAVKVDKYQFKIGDCAYFTPNSVNFSCNILIF